MRDRRAFDFGGADAVDGDVEDVVRAPAGMWRLDRNPGAILPARNLTLGSKLSVNRGYRLRVTAYCKRLQLTREGGFLW